MIEIIEIIHGGGTTPYQSRRPYLLWGCDRDGDGNVLIGFRILPHRANSEGIYITESQVRRIWQGDLISTSRYYCRVRAYCHPLIPEEVGAAQLNNQSGPSLLG